MHSVPASLLEKLRHYPSPANYVVAYSGGCDSHVLLHALIQIQAQLDCQLISVVHIDHGLQEQSADWAQHCQAICQQYDVPFTTISLNLEIPNGESVEAYARKARYAALEKHVGSDDMLLLAQHQDDQAETMLLQLIRGSGVKGLAAMPEIVKVNDYWQARPLLGVTRSDIQSYAEQSQLDWIEDPSNQDNRFDRNFLRNDVFPVLQQRWPSLSETMSRASRHQAEADSLLKDLAELDWQTCRMPEQTLLTIESLKKLDPARQRNLLRYWITNKCQFPMPDRVQCQRILDEILPASEDAEPVVCWADVVVRRYRDTLYIEQAAQTDYALFTGWQKSWDLQSPLRLPSGQQLIVQQKKGQGMVLPEAANSLMVRFRLGGEKCRLPGRQHRHELKKLLQGWGVPPWQRDKIPLLYIGDELAQVVGYSICEPFLAKSEQMGFEISLIQ